MAASTGAGRGGAGGGGGGGGGRDGGRALRAGQRSVRLKQSYWHLQPGLGYHFTTSRSELFLINKRGIRCIKLNFFTG